jgi:ClpP class serine protease
VKYLDQVEADLLARFRNESDVLLSDFSLEEDFLTQPRRALFQKINETEMAAKQKEERRKRKRNLNSFPAKPYLRKMRFGYKILRGLSVKPSPGAPRIAVINAVGGIQSGRSSQGGPTGQSLGSDTLISLVRRAKADNNIKAVVLRIDSPGKN